MSSSSLSYSVPIDRPPFLVSWRHGFFVHVPGILFPWPIELPLWIVHLPILVVAIAPVSILLPGRWHFGPTYSLGPRHDRETILLFSS